MSKAKFLISNITDGEPVKLFQYYNKFIRYYKNCELQHKEWWMKNAKKDWTVIDAGANVGVFSVLFGRLCKKVVAIEPCPTTVKYLKHNLAQNGITNVEVIQKALGNITAKRNDTVYHVWGDKPMKQQFEFSTLDDINIL